jgi:glycosyltransferase involved in cell wall biosynthesis
VLYYGKYIPLHGVEYIIEAADLLRDSSAIEFELVGRGPTRARAEALAQEKHLANVKFTDWIEPAELPNYAARADILLGVFANSVQSTHIVPNKVYEALALGRPIVTGDSETSRSRFTNGQHALLIERCNPRALAEAIAKLSRDPELCERLALDGRRQFEAHFTPTVLGNRLFERLCQLCPERV